MIKNSVLIFLIMCSIITFGADNNYRIDWIESFNTGAIEAVNVIQNGYLLGGAVFSSDKTLEVKGNADALLIRYDEKESEFESMVFGGNGYDIFSDLKVVENGSILLAGKTSSDDIGEYKTLSESDPWVIKLDKDLNKIWEKRYYSDFDCNVEKIEIVEDGYLVIGYIMGDYQAEDSFILKINQDGQKVFFQIYGDHSDESISSVFEMENHYLVFADKRKNPRTGRGQERLWFFEIEKDHGYVINENFSTKFNDFMLCESKMVTDGYLLGGLVSIPSERAEDIILMKLDQDLNTIWKRTLRGEDREIFRGITLMNEKGDFAIPVMSASSNTEMFEKNSGSWDIWLLIFDGESCELLNKTHIPGNGYEEALGITKTLDNEIIIVGVSNSTSGAFVNPDGSFRGFLMKLSQ